jgi:hypothetical protein
MLQYGYFYEALQHMSQSQPPEKDPIGVAFGKLGASAGGKARAKKLSAKRRSEIARKAGQARAKNMNSKDRSEAARKAVQARWIAKKK